MTVEKEVDFQENLQAGVDLGELHVVLVDYGQFIINWWLEQLIL